MFAPLAPYASVVTKLGVWPDLTVLQTLLDGRAVRNRRGIPLRVVEPDASGEPYEQRIYARGELPVRESDWHDLFNVLAWLTYPLSKAALNERHALSASQEFGDEARAGRRPNRSRVRDALTLFDESGAVILSNDPELLQDVRSFRWKPLFWAQRSRTAAAMRCFLFGHAIFEKALEPYIGMTAHATTFVVLTDFVADPIDCQLARIDALVAERIRAPHEFVAPRMLAPVPVLGIPGWWKANEAACFYDDERYFRHGRKSGTA